MTTFGELRNGFAKAGFRDVSEEILTIGLDFDHFEDYWQPLLSGQGTIKEFLAGLSASTRNHTEEGVRLAYLGERPDGPRGFASVPWVVRGFAPLFTS